jgi:hypothetical protein
MSGFYGLWRFFWRFSALGIRGVRSSKTPPKKLQLYRLSIKKRSASYSSEQAPTTCPPPWCPLGLETPSHRALYTAVLHCRRRVDLFRLSTAAPRVQGPWPRRKCTAQRGRAEKICSAGTSPCPWCRYPLFRSIFHLPYARLSCLLSLASLSLVFAKSLSLFPLLFGLGCFGTTADATGPPWD